MTIEDRILQSWHTNASAWIQAVRRGAIDSRLVATNAAIIQTVMECKPRSVLDVGCGEGWLGQSLESLGVSYAGTDGCPTLCQAAREVVRGDVHELRYAQLSQAALGFFDAIVCNFSLIGVDDLPHVLMAAPSLLRDGGTLVVQTVHPSNTSPESACDDGWRDGTWSGCGEGFKDASPWYFRTPQSWKVTLGQAPFVFQSMVEVTHPATGRLLSVIFRAQLQRTRPHATSSRSIDARD